MVTSAIEHHTGSQTELLRLLLYQPAPTKPWQQSYAAIDRPTTDLMHMGQRRGLSAQHTTTTQ